jgi:hypothetical protein
MRKKRRRAEAPRREGPIPGDIGDDEAADDEEEVDPRVAEGESAGRRERGGGGRKGASHPAEVPDDDRERRERAQELDGDERFRPGAGRGDRARQRGGRRARLRRDRATQLHALPSDRGSAGLRRGVAGRWPSGSRASRSGSSRAHRAGCPAGADLATRPDEICGLGFAQKAGLNVRQVVEVISRRPRVRGRVA